ncbi:MAG: replication-associated recombination protein A [Chloroflexi bacterium]|nr:replication-associated recombination protein A [Chloroflexota bacterium]MCY4246356.1 replication-associated recombination protein A [Chloroflexota bacterium]
MPDSPQPLAERIRPRDLSAFIGQAHLVGAGKPLNRALQQRAVPSMVLWGPPGVGKTTLARMIADAADKPFYNLSAVSAGKAELRAIVNSLGRAPASQPGLFHADAAQPASAILFLDEIHRFNKAQQDFLLPYVEDGRITLIGATTENPSFEVISALLSRMQVFTLAPLTIGELEQIIARGADALQLAVMPEAADFLANYANGDARAALNLLDNAARLYRADAISAEHLRETLQSKHLRYDKSGEEHYNTISAFIKSMRASDIDAALYYLARMVASGEDPKFIARRMVIFASEDIGMADSAALTVANDVFRAVETVGLPECQFHLAHGVVYLAGAPKDRSAGRAYFDALEDAKQRGNLPIPLRLRNAPTSLMRELGYGRDYQAYTDDSLLPEGLKGKRYYRR